MLRRVVSAPTLSSMLPSTEEIPKSHSTKASLCPTPKTVHSISPQSTPSSTSGSTSPSFVHMQRSILTDMGRTTKSPIAPPNSNRILHSKAYFTPSEVQHIHSLIEPITTTKLTKEEMLHAREHNPGYALLEQSFSPLTITEIEKIGDSTLILTTKEAENNHTSRLIVSLNSTSVTYYETDKKLSFNPLTHGHFKQFGTVSSKGLQIPVTVETKQHFKQKIVDMPILSKKLYDAVQEGLPGAEHIVIPQRIRSNEGNQFLLAYSHHGNDLFDAVEQRVAAGKQIHEEVARLFVRDIYMANYALREMGIHNYDIKLENCVIVADGDKNRTARIVLIDIDDFSLDMAGHHKGSTFSDKGLHYQMEKATSTIIKVGDEAKEIFTNIYQNLLMIKAFEEIRNTNTIDSVLFECFQTHCLEKNLLATFVATPAPITFLEKIKEVYEERNSISDVRRLEDIQKTYKKNMEKAGITELDSIYCRLELMGRLLPDDADIIREHHQELLHLYFEENSEDEVSFIGESSVDTVCDINLSEGLTEIISGILTTKDAMKRHVSELREIFGLTQEEISDEELCFLAHLLMNTQQAILYYIPHPIGKSSSERKKVLKANEMLQSIMEKILKLEDYKAPVGIPSLYGMVPILNATEEVEVAKAVAQQKSALHTKEQQKAFMEMLTNRLENLALMQQAEVETTAQIEEEVDLYADMPALED